jgi:hypothetical protein
MPGPLLDRRFALHSATAIVQLCERHVSKVTYRDNLAVVVAERATQALPPEADAIMTAIHALDRSEPWGGHDVSVEKGQKGVEIAVVERLT